MELKTPIPWQSVHQELFAEIKQAVKLGGRTGKAAHLVVRLSERHFANEEKFALPLLGLLSALTQDAIEPGMAAAIFMAEKLRIEMPNLIAEQRAIVAALEELMAAAESECHAGFVGFAEKLMLHEEIEREMSYPTAILIGKYLQLRLNA